MSAPPAAVQPLAVTHSAWINAWTLQQACARLGVQLRLAAPAGGFPIPLLGQAEQPFNGAGSVAQALDRALAGFDARRIPRLPQAGLQAPVSGTDHET